MLHSYQKLLYDVARIEAGHDVEFKFFGTPATSSSSSSTATSSSSSAQPNASSGASLTVEEEGLLLDALNDSNLLTPTSAGGMLPGVKMEVGGTKRKADEGLVEKK